jgi:hypothetical protein
MRTVRRGADTAATVLRVIGLAIVAVLVAHILLTLLANPTHELTVLVARLADWVDLGLNGLFQPSDPGLATVLNYGLAALVWYLIMVVAVRLVRRVG